MTRVGVFCLANCLSALRSAAVQGFPEFRFDLLITWTVPFGPDGTHVRAERRRAPIATTVSTADPERILCPADG